MYFCTLLLCIILTMKYTFTTLAILLLSAITFTIHAQPGYTPAPDNLQARQAFNNDRFGIFIHWGLYSMLGDGEWVMTNKNISYREYPALAQGFYPSRFNANEWVKAIKASGAKYITITTRHHDGFSMWNSSSSDYNIVKATPYHKDIIGQIAKACHRQNIRLHLYYSHLDWVRTDYFPRGRTGKGTDRPNGSPEDWNHYMKFINAQLTELLTHYGPIGAIWFDGIWDKDSFPREAQPEIWNLYEQYALIHSLQPACLIGNNHHLLPFEGEDIQIFERDIPGNNEYGLSGQDVSSLPLETCQTMNRSWGYRITDTTYKSAEYLIQYLVRTAGKGANLLLNIGPRPDGSIPPQAISRLQAIGQWMKQYGNTIYCTQGGIVPEQPWGVTTQKGKELYVHVLGEYNTILLPVKAENIVSAYMYNTTVPVKYTPCENGVTLQVPCNNKTDNIVTVTLQ